MIIIPPPFIFPYGGPDPDPPKSMLAKIGVGIAVIVMFFTIVMTGWIGGTLLGMTITGFYHSNLYEIGGAVLFAIMAIGFVAWIREQ